MNICDSEVILSIIIPMGYTNTNDIRKADVIILNCCSVREIGHKKAFERLNFILESGLSEKIIIVCGCFATQINKSFFNDFPWVNAVIGPDNYRLLTSVLKSRMIHVLYNGFNNSELYSDIIPYRTLENKTTAAITVMKGCNQNCTYCIEPLTRGTESSRDLKSILEECHRIKQQGFKEITFVGHIVDKYSYGLSLLLETAATTFPDIRFRFLSSHPVSCTDDIVDVIKNNANIMKIVHLPVQSGSDRILSSMNRGYSRSQYIKRVNAIRKAIPDIRIVSDIMVGFCGETTEDFKQTISLIRELEFDDINIFRFSIRKKTTAAAMLDDVSDDEKDKRYNCVKHLRDEIALKKNKQWIGSIMNVINEGAIPGVGLNFGRDNHHLPVRFNTTSKKNENVRLKITDANDSFLIGHEYNED